MALNIRLAKIQGSRERRDLEERMGLARKHLFTPTDDEVLQQANENAKKFRERKIAEAKAVDYTEPSSSYNQQSEEYKQ